MSIIIQSFILSIAVAWRMFLPIIGIFIASSFLLGFLDGFTGGLASTVGNEIVIMLIMLYGIRTAFSLMGDNRGTAWDILLLNSVIYGVLLWLVVKVVMAFVLIGGAAFTNWELFGTLSAERLLNATDIVQGYFVFGTVWIYATMGFTFYVAVYAAFGVPLAAAARSATQGPPSTGFLFGFGRKALPLFLVFAVSFFLQFFAGILTAFLAILPFLLSVITFLLSGVLRVPDLEIIIMGGSATFALLWLHAWTWSAMALAFKSYEGAYEPPRPVRAEPEVTTADIRALRKSRG